MKNEKWAMAAMGVVFVLILFLSVLVAICLFGKDEKKFKEKVEENKEFVMDEDGNSSANMEMEFNDTSTEEKTGDENGESDYLYIVEPTEKGVTFVMDGIEMYVPPLYYCYYEEELGCIVDSKEAFQMRFEIEESSYQELLEKKSQLTEVAVQSGYEVTKEPTELMVGGKAYLYFTTRIEVDKVFVIYTQSPDADRSTSTQLVLFDETLTDEEVVTVFSDMVANAKETDAPDSTADEILEQNFQTLIGEEKEESTLEFGLDSVTFQVKEGFYSTVRAGNVRYVTETFEEEEYNVSVQCYLYGKESYRSAEEYIRSWMKWERDSALPLKVENEEVGECLWYYFIASNEEGDIRRLYAAYNHSETSIYCIEVTCMNPDMEFGVDKIREFMQVVE